MHLCLICERTCRNYKLNHNTACLRSWSILAISGTMQLKNWHHGYIRMQEQELHLIRPADVKKPFHQDFLSSSCHYQQLYLKIKTQSFLHFIINNMDRAPSANTYLEAIASIKNTKEF